MQSLLYHPCCSILLVNGVATVVVVVGVDVVAVADVVLNWGNSWPGSSNQTSAGPHPLPATTLAPKGSSITSKRTGSECHMTTTTF